MPSCDIKVKNSQTDPVSTIKAYFEVFDFAIGKKTLATFGQRLFRDPTPTF
jgi:hypothetical protein